MNKVRGYIVIMDGINQQRHSVTCLTFRTKESNYETYFMALVQAGLVEQSKAHSLSSNSAWSENIVLFAMMLQRSQ